VAQFKSEGKLLEAQRIRQRTEYDLEMLGSVGTCAGSRTTRVISRGAGRASARAA
jgi:excinuclease ABC subunit B